MKAAESVFTIPGATAPVLRPHRTSHYTRKTDNCLAKPLLVRFVTICTKHIFQQSSLFQKVCTDTQQESLIVLSVRCFNILLIVQINIVDIGLHGPVSPWFDYHKSEGQAEHLCCEIAMSRSKCSIMTPWRHHMIDGTMQSTLCLSFHSYTYLQIYWVHLQWMKTAASTQSNESFSNPWDHLLTHMGITQFTFPA